ncbi:hypothetical protein ACHAWF_013116 [Thalassiosira exigua]
MGSMRDERLNRMWQGKRVKFLRPDRARAGGGGPDGGAGRGGDDAMDDGYDESSWFNVFALHQNRDLGRGSKNCVHESMIPEWMDLVVWGHEHECNIEPQESLVGTFRVTQPGSSVATSLTQGESKRKHCGILEVRGQQFRLTKVPLSSVRSFAVGEVSLGDSARGSGGKLDAEDPRVEERTNELLVEEVQTLIQRARDEAEHLRQDAEEEARRSRSIEDEFDPNRRQRKYEIQKPDRVLVRLKVEHTGFATLNNQRFGAQFVEEVANPSDILLFHKRRQAESAKGGKAASKKRSAAGLDVPTEPEDLEKINVDDLVAENLANSDKKLQLLDEKSMGEALEQYVEKKNIKAIEEIAQDILRENQKILVRRGKEGGSDGKDTLDNPTSVREALDTITGKKRAEYELEREDADEEKRKKRESSSKETSSARKRVNSKAEDSLSDSEEEEKRPTKKKSRVATTSKKALAKSRGKYNNSDEDFDDEDDKPAPKKRAQTAKKAATTTKKSGPRKRRTDDSDSEIEFVGTQSTARSQTQRPAARSAARAGRSTAKKPKYTYDESDVEEIEESDVEETPAPRAKKPTARSTGTSKARASSQTQSTMLSFTSTRKPATASRGRANRSVRYAESDSDDEPSSSFGGGGAWGSASQSTKGRTGRR